MRERTGLGLRGYRGVTSTEQAQEALSEFVPGSHGIACMLSVVNQGLGYHQDASTCGRHQLEPPIVTNGGLGEWEGLV